MRLVLTERVVTAAPVGIDHPRMATCPVCGRRFDERRYQLLVPAVGSFDSIACVEEALRRHGRERHDLVPALLDVISSARSRRATTAGGLGETDREDEPDR